MSQADSITRFTFDKTSVRGQYISLDASWLECQQHNPVDETARVLLGDSLAAISLLANTLKFDGKITLQIRGLGPLDLLVAQAKSDHSIRGLVRQSGNRDLSQPNNLVSLFGNDRMVITIDSGQGQPHQGIVELTGSNIAEALQSYFKHSEQLPTQLWLSSDQHRARGLLIQKLPGSDEDEDGWNRISQLAATLTDKELLTLSGETLLHRLFHEESLRIYPAKQIRFNCSCSLQKSRDLIKSLGQTEAESILQEQGEIKIQCEFCNANYCFDPVDIAQLFADNSQNTGNQTVH